MPPMRKGGLPVRAGQAEDAMIQALTQARELLRELTPLHRDCGRLCDGACCQGDESSGMLLFPGEETLYEGKDTFRILPASYTLCDRPALLLICTGSCHREERPLSCRLFPVFPAAAGLRMDPRAHALCPLASSGLSGLSGDFLTACRAAAELLHRDPECHAFLLAVEQTLQDPFGFAPRSI